MRASDNTILITGGASGLGFALARRLVASGNVVIICGRDQRKLDEACRIEPRLIAYKSDVADAASRVELARSLSQRFPLLNVLINNAGQVNVSSLDDADFIEKLESETAANFTGPVALIHLLAPLLKANHDSTVVNITSGYVFLASARTPHYAATKAALHSMTQSLRYQLKDTTIRVLEIMPPPVKTAMAAHYGGTKSEIEPTADLLLRALVGKADEVPIGVSRLASLLGRFAPRLGFRFMNDAESRQAKS